jgi:hypothetical protein
MQRKTMHEQCERLRNLDATDLRRKCARFVLDHGHAIAAARPAIPDSLNDRAGDIWEPLLALADLAGAPWPDLARQAACALTAGAHDNNPIGSLLFDLLVIFGRWNTDRLFSRTLVQGLNLSTDRPWKEMNKGREINELWLAARLRPYGVRPKSIWIGDVVGKGYLIEDFAEVFRRYIPEAEVRAELERLAGPNDPAPYEAPTNS